MADHWPHPDPAVADLIATARAQAAADALAPIRAFHDRLGETDLDDLDALAVWEDLGALLQGGQPC